MRWGGAHALWTVSCYLGVIGILRAGTVDPHCQGIFGSHESLALWLAVGSPITVTDQLFD